MRMILTDESFTDVGYLPEDAELDLEIGSDRNNDLQIAIPGMSYDPQRMPVGGALYAQGTEYGGILGDIESDTRDEMIYITCDTWRGMLEYSIIEPPAGQSHRVISGELHAVMKTLLGDKLGTLYDVPSESTGVSVTNWQIDRYVTLLAAYEKLLASVGHRLNIEADGQGESLRIILRAVPIVDYSSEVEISQDAKVDFVITQKNRRYTHMICAGRGELQNRQIIYLHQKPDGSVEKVTSIPEGLGVRTYFYDYSSVESLAELEKAGRQQFKDINETDTQEVHLEGEDLLTIGDMVGGRDYVTGIYVSQPITSKVVKITGGQLSVEYKIGE